MGRLGESGTLPAQETSLLTGVPPYLTADRMTSLALYSRCLTSSCGFGDVEEFCLITIEYCKLLVRRLVWA